VFVQGATAAINALETPPGGTKHNAELPLLRGLLFVSKPMGYFKLPTKFQLYDPARPVHPCLSDSVNE